MNLTEKEKHNKLLTHKYYLFRVNDGLSDPSGKHSSYPHSAQPLCVNQWTQMRKASPLLGTSIGYSSVDSYKVDSVLGAHLPHSVF